MTTWLVTYRMPAHAPDTSSRTVVGYNETDAAIRFAILMNLRLTTDIRVVSIEEIKEG